jgi:hypothetical protein
MFRRPPKEKWGTESEDWEDIAIPYKDDRYRDRIQTRKPQDSDREEVKERPSRKLVKPPPVKSQQPVAPKPKEQASPIAAPPMSSLLDFDNPAPTSTNQPVNEFAAFMTEPVSRPEATVTSQRPFPPQDERQAFATSERAEKGSNPFGGDTQYDPFAVPSG